MPAPSDFLHAFDDKWKPGEPFALDGNAWGDVLYGWSTSGNCAEARGEVVFTGAGSRDVERTKGNGVAMNAVAYRLAYGSLQASDLSAVVVAVGTDPWRFLRKQEAPRVALFGLLCPDECQRPHEAVRSLGSILSRIVGAVSHVVTDKKRDGDPRAIARALGPGGTLATIVPLRGNDGATPSLQLADIAEHRGEILGLVTVAHDLARLDIRAEIAKQAKPFNWPDDMIPLGAALSSRTQIPSGLLVLNGKTGKGKTAFSMNLAVQALADGRSVLYVATETPDTIHARAACLMNARDSEWDDVGTEDAKKKGAPLTRWAEIRSDLSAWRAAVSARSADLRNLFVLNSNTLEAETYARGRDASPVDVILDKAKELMARDKAPPLVVVDFLQGLPIDSRTDLTRGVGDFAKQLATRVADPDDENPRAWPGTTVVALSSTSRSWGEKADLSKIQEASGVAGCLVVGKNRGDGAGSMFMVNHESVDGGLQVQRVHLSKSSERTNHALEMLALTAAKESGNVEYLAATVLSWFPVPDPDSPKGQRA
jgi:hypothetical protein